MLASLLTSNLWAYMITFQDVQMYLEPPTNLSKQEQMYRAFWILLVGIFMLKRLKRKSPAMFNLVCAWADIHKHRTAYQLFDIK
jgi:hypothetical protein